MAPMDDKDNAVDALNLPTPVPTKRGIVNVRELSMMDALVASEAFFRLARGVAAIPGDPSDTFGRMVIALRTHRIDALEIIAAATDKTGQELGDLGVSDFTRVLEAFVDRNAEIVDRFFVLKGKFEELVRRAEGASAKQ